MNHSPNRRGSYHDSEPSDGGRSSRLVDRSRSRSNSQKRGKRHSRSRSRSCDRSRRESRNQHRECRRSRLPSRRKSSGHQDDREAPSTGRCLGVFGLSIYTHQRDLEEIFGVYGSIEDVQIVFNAQTGRSRGYAFLYFKDTNAAREAKEKCNGMHINGRQIRVDFSITKRAHTPTPGIYLGKSSLSKDRGDEARLEERFNRDRSDKFHDHDNFRERRDFSRRSASPHYRRDSGRDRSPQRSRANRY